MGLFHTHLLPVDLDPMFVLSVYQLTRSLFAGSRNFFNQCIPFRSLTDNIWMDQTQELIHGVGLSGILHFWYICPGSFLKFSFLAVVLFRGKQDSF